MPASVSRSPSLLAQTLGAEPVDLIATLDAVCVSAGGDAARAAELAAEAGFSPVPDSMVPGLRNASDTAGFMKSNASDIVFVMTGKMSRRIGRERVSWTSAASAPVRPSTGPWTSACARPWGSRPSATAAWTPMPGCRPKGRAPTRDLRDPTFIAMAETGQMRMVALQRSGPGSTLIYFLPRLD